MLNKILSIKIYIICIAQSSYEEQNLISDSLTMKISCLSDD
jgi:hypothetical protein